MKFQENDAEGLYYQIFKGVNCPITNFIRLYVSLMNFIYLLILNMKKELISHRNVDIFID